MSLLLLLSVFSFHASSEPTDTQVDTIIEPKVNEMTDEQQIPTELELNIIKEQAFELSEVNEADIDENENKIINEPPADLEQIITQTSFSLSGKPKYDANFTHFEYANPNAPKGGTLKLAEIGGYDSFNRYASRGVSERNIDMITESLFTQSADDITSYYPLLATSITYSNKFNWAEVKINPNAHFSDNSKVTAKDVEFTFQKLMTQGVSQYRVYYENYQVKAIDESTVRFDIPEPSKERLLSFVGNFPVLPEHFWQDKNLAEPLTEPPVGSGPYLIADYKLGQHITYVLDDNYWGKSLPVNQGLNNFITKKIEYYLDDNVALEAFKAGEYDVRTEAQPKNWFTQYQGPYFDNKSIIKQQDELKTATSTRWLAMNLEKPLFKDIRVREALTLAFDFAWLNHAFYYDSYQQPRSFFENTQYAAKGLPSEQEFVWLNQYKDIIPAKAFGKAYRIKPSNGDGFNRDNLLKAKKLLQEAGWIVKNNQLVNEETGEPFEFELLVYMASDSKYTLMYQEQLAMLGIKMNINAVDHNQMVFRMRNRDYDMMPTLYTANPYPSSGLMILWGSQYLNSTWNSTGLHNKAIDELIEQIPLHADDESTYQAMTRALDRILTQEYAMIPMWYPKYTYYAYWDKFDKPEIKPLYGIGIDAWWFDAQKAAKLSKNNY